MKKTTHMKTMVMHDEDDGDDTNDDSYQWQTPMADVAVIKRRR